MNNGEYVALKISMAITPDITKLQAEGHVLYHDNADMEMSGRKAV